MNVMTWRGPGWRRTGKRLALAAMAATLTVASSGSAGAGVGIGDEPITLSMYVETGFPLLEALAEEFERQHPNVDFDITAEQFNILSQNAPRLMASDDAPDLIRLNLTNDLVRDGLLLNLDRYVEEYEWSAFPASQLDPLRFTDDGAQRGTGSLFGFGVGYTVTGVYYNRDLAQQIGMEAPPASLAELEQLLEAAKDAGLVPIAQANVAGESNMTYQPILNQFVDPQIIRDFINQVPGASIDVPEALEATEVFSRWAASGYVSEDANAVDYTTMVGRFTAGEAVFMFLGDWEASNLDASMGDNVGFFLMPPLESGGQYVAMSASVGIAIPARAEHPDAAAYFLNWTQTNEVARQIVVDVAGSSPGGPPELPQPDVDPDSVLADTRNAFQQLNADDGAVGFIVDATAGMFQNTFAPELQLLIAGQTGSQDFLERIQAAYQENVGQ